MIVAVPSDAPGGLDAQISDHFGHCDVFTLVQVDGEQIGDVTLLPNGEHEHGGCMAPVALLKDNGAQALIAGGMGKRPLMGFQQVGIPVHCKEDATTVREAILLFIEDKCCEFGSDQVCGGHGGCGHGHHHEPVQREAVDGPAEKDRVVILSCRLTDDEGNVLDEAMQVPYLHGHGQLVAGLEKAVEGLRAGETVNVTVSPEDGYGERDESRIMEVPSGHLPEGIEVGAMVQAQMPGGGMVPLIVVSMEGPNAILDGNHPLAGKTLTYDATVVEVQAATPEELSHGHIH
jgi:FKBP-type peptidyl-prolyl cis-trans isomerase 2/predicted Fe-Mo cluster-binding NifX family protein